MIDSNSGTKWRELIYSYAPLILWIGVIFVASSGTGSMSNTSRIIRPLLEFLFPGAPEETLIIYHGYIRKFAHFAEYAGLAFWASRAFSRSGAHILGRFWYFGALLLTLLVAIADETNQSFNTARTSSARDVAIDFAGGLAMVVFFYTVKRILGNKKRSDE